MTNALLEVFAEDRRMIAYRPKLAKHLGSVTAAILLQQILYWYVHNKRKPFYKFKEPCEHPEYRENDSWTEELAFSRAEFDHALDRIGFKRGKKKDQSQNEENALVLYWTDMNRRTWYSVNESALRNVLNQLYVTSESDVTKSDFSAIDSTEMISIDEHKESSAPSRGLEVPEQQPLLPDETQETPEPVPSLKEESGDSEKKEAAPKKPRPPNPLFDAVAEHYFNAPPGSERVTAISGRVGVVLKALRTIDPNLTPDRIKESAVLFRKKNPGCTMPKGKDTVADAYSAWLEVRRQSTAAPRPGQRRLNVSDAADTHYDVFDGKTWKREAQGISP